MKKFWFRIIAYLLALILFGCLLSYIGSSAWFADATDLQEEIFVLGFCFCFCFFFLGAATHDLIDLLPWPQIRQKLFKRKSPPPADPE